MKKLITKFLATSVVASLLLVGCGSTETTVESEVANDNPLYGKTIIVGCSSTFVPYESVVVNTDGTTENVGMNIEIIETILAKNGATAEFSDMPFKSIIGSIQAGHIDMNISGMTPNAEREETMDFSEIYFYPRNAIISTEENFYETLEDLEGLTIAYPFGTNYQGIAESIKNVDAVGIQGSPACVEEVKIGRADACIFDGASATEYVKNNDGLKLSLMEKIEADCFAIGFPKESPYYETVNNTLIEMMENGELDAIIAKHLAEEFILD